jgi:CubicO group peptidase (beta-lactamase class C family)
VWGLRQSENAQQGDFSLQTLRCSFATFAVKELDRKKRKEPAKRAKIGLVWLLCLAALPLCRAENGVGEDQIEHIFADLKSAGEPGAAVLVLQNGRVVFQRGYGVTDLRSLHKIDAQTNFRLASCTKQFTAMAIMLLVHDGRLHYEDRLTDVFPDFPVYGKSITIRNLLNHTSGLLDYEDLMQQPSAAVPADKIPQIKDAGVLDILKQQKTTKFPPGTKWEYSNSGYAVLAMIVEKVSGQPFGSFLHDRIFIPLKMDHTVAYEKGKNEVTNRAYGNTREQGTWRQTDQSPTSAVLGDGGTYSSLDDLAKWDHALQQHTLLSEAEMRPAVTPVKVPDNNVLGPDGKPAEYGFGWFLNSYRGHRRMWHYGETVGFRTTIQRFVDDQLTIIVLCNRADPAPTDLALKVADLFLSSHH